MALSCQMPGYFLNQILPSIAVCRTSCISHLYGCWLLKAGSAVQACITVYSEMSDSFRGKPLPWNCPHTNCTYQVKVGAKDPSGCMSHHIKKHHSARRVGRPHKQKVGRPPQQKLGRPLKQKASVGRAPNKVAAKKPAGKCATPKFAAAENRAELRSKIMQWWRQENMPSAALLPTSSR